MFTAEKTAIDSFVYTVLRRTGNSEHHGFVSGYADSLFGLFRNDSANRKVFFRRNFSDSADKVLYDFSLNAGDTIPFTWVGVVSLSVIDSVDTVWMYGQPRKRMSFTDCSSIPSASGSIIEGIGSVHGFAEQLTVPLEHMIYELECFSYKDSAYSGFREPPTLVNPTYSGSVCWLYSGTETIEEDISDVMVLPNPFSSQLTFVIGGNLQHSLLLYNFLGQQVLGQSFLSTATITTEYLSSGIYFYELRNINSVVANGKVVKQ